MLSLRKRSWRSGGRICAGSGNDAEAQDGAEADLDQDYLDAGPPVPGVVPGRAQIETGELDDEGRGELDDDEAGELARVESPSPEPSPAHRATASSTSCKEAGESYNGYSGRIVVR